MHKLFTRRFEFGLIYFRYMLIPKLMLIGAFLNSGPFSQMRSLIPTHATKDSVRCKKVNVKHYGKIVGSLSRT